MHDELDESCCTAAFSGHIQELYLILAAAYIACPVTWRPWLGLRHRIYVNSQKINADTVLHRNEVLLE